MTLTEVQISEIKNLNLIYIFTTDHILRGKTDKYVGAKVVFDGNRTLSLDYKSPYFESFLKRIIERYNKEKDSRYIVLLGKLTEKLMNDETFASIGSIEDKKTTGLTLFDTKNHELKKYESYLKDTLKNILKLTLGYEVINIDKIDGFNNKYVVYYSVGTVNLECRLILSFRDDTHLDFKISHVGKTNLGITGTIENNISLVSVDWKSDITDLEGHTTYDAINNETEKKILGNNETVQYSEEAETLIDTDIELINFYLNLFGIEVLPNIIKTGEYNYILGDEEIKNSEDTELFYKRTSTQISINDSLVILRHQVQNGLNKYHNQINVTLDKTTHDITMSKVLIDKSEYVLIEHRTTNEFGSVYDYKIYQVDNLDFKSIFVPKEEATIDTTITSIEDVKKYVRKRKEGGTN